MDVRIVYRMMSIIFIYFFLQNIFAAEFIVNEVNVDCDGPIENCAIYKENLAAFKKSFYNYNHLRSVLKLYLKDDAIANLSYEVVKSADRIILNVKLRPNMIVDEIFVENKGLFRIDLPSLLPLQEGDYVTDEAVERTKNLLTEIMGGKGYPYAKVQSRIEIEDGNHQVYFKIKRGKPLMLKKIEVESNYGEISAYVGKRLRHFNKKPFALQDIKTELVSIKLELQEMGFYLNEMTMRYRKIDVYDIELFVSVAKIEKYVFNFKGNQYFSTYDLKKTVASYVQLGQRVPSPDYIKTFLIEHYMKNGFFETMVDAKIQTYQDKKGVKVHQYLLNINEGPRTYVNKVNFIGNRGLTNTQLRRLYYSDAPDQVGAGYYQKEYSQNFVGKVKEAFIQKGYLSVLVEEPYLKRISSSEIELEYRIREGIRTVVDSINFDGISPADAYELGQLISNKENNYFNPIAFAQDLKTIEENLYKKGYYFAKIINKESLVRFVDDNTTASINIIIQLGEQQRINHIFYIGAKKTRQIYLERHLGLNPKQVLIKEELQAAQSRLLATGLFSSLSINPIPVDAYKSDLIVYLREKDFGIVEFAPGYRTDIGVKISGALTYLNLDGMGKQIVLRGQVNQRLNLNLLDERRREEGKNLVEYNLGVSFTENNIFYSDFDFTTSLSRVRRRFYAFDADISRLTATVSRDITDWFSISLTEQLESISQFDATNELDSGEFQIGSLTPSMIFDFRRNTFNPQNARINPTSGGLMSLSLESANEYFGSQSNDELVVDYYKLIMRNRLYFSVDPKNSLAIALTLGQQENLATRLVRNDLGDLETEGYVPNIKVFRLSGIDTVRGFNDNEINRLPNGESISDIRVDGKAYLINFKFEPRTQLSDSTVLGLFYDAGGIFVGEPEFDQLRSSVGISFKYLTPVGSLDFDYGIKLLRKRDIDGNLDSPGRLHVSIGFF